VSNCILRVEFLVYPGKPREKNKVNISSTVVVKATKQRISLWWCQNPEFSSFTQEKTNWICEKRFAEEFSRESC